MRTETDKAVGTYQAAVIRHRAAAADREAKYQEYVQCSKAETDAKALVDATRVKLLTTARKEALQLPRCQYEHRDGRACWLYNSGAVPDCYRDCPYYTEEASE